jgi:hypothetical protein
MFRIKQYILAVLVIMACLPTVISYTPVQATAMANNTATSLVSIHNTTAGWIVGGSNYVGCVTSNNTQYSMGIRFSAVPIPQGSTINSAYLLVTSSGTYAQDTVSSIIMGEDADTAAAFAGTYLDYDGRSKTSASVSWYGIDHWALGTQYASPDIATVVSEVVNRAGWTTGNNMVLFWDDRAKASSQSTYMPANVRGGSTYILMVDYTSPTAVIVPEITTTGASNLGSTTAVLNALLNDDGNDPNGAAVRFGYDTITHAGNFALYGTITAWSTSNYTSSDVIASVLTGLTPTTPYFFNVQSQNSAGVVEGLEMQFVTGTTVTTLTPSNFVLSPQSTSIGMQWVKPSGFSEVKLYFKSGSIPSSNTTGTLLYSGSNDYYTHSSLLSGSTYGYLLYGYEPSATPVWSSTTSGIVTTKGTSTSTPLATPTTPTDWFLETDYTTQSATFVYPIVNNIADSLSMPRNTAWVTWALGVCMFLGFLIWSASRSMVAVTIAVVVGVWIGQAQHLIPLVILLFVLVFGLSIIAIKERI